MSSSFSAPQASKKGAMAGVSDQEWASKIPLPPAPSSESSSSSVWPDPRSVPLGFGASTKTITEGSAVVLYPGKEAVFYNPAQVLNRDLSVMVLRTFERLRSQGMSATACRRTWIKAGLPIPAELSNKKTDEAESGTPTNGEKERPSRFPMPGLRVLEALAASGIRSVRYAKEVQNIATLVVNDLDPAAIGAIRANMSYNGLSLGKQVISTVRPLENLRRGLPLPSDPFLAPAAPADDAISDSSRETAWRMEKDGRAQTGAVDRRPVVVPSHSDAVFLMQLHKDSPLPSLYPTDQRSGVGSTNAATEDNEEFKPPPSKRSRLEGERAGGKQGKDESEANKVPTSAEPTSAGSSNFPPASSYAFKPFDVVDLDPYGSASPFLDSAVSCIVDGGLLCVTCTDMTVLAGNHRDACHGKYGAIPVKGPHFAEQAVRMVLLSIENACVRNRRSMKPLLSLSIDFYIRVFVRILDSPKEASLSPLKIGTLLQCTGCEAFWVWPRGKWQQHTARNAAGSGGTAVGEGIEGDCCDYDGEPARKDRKVRNKGTQWPGHKRKGEEDAALSGISRHPDTPAPPSSSSSSASSTAESRNDATATSSTAVALSKPAQRRIAGFNTSFDSYRDRPAGYEQSKAHVGPNNAAPPLPEGLKSLPIALVQTSAAVSTGAGHTEGSAASASVPWVEPEPSSMADPAAVCACPHCGRGVQQGGPTYIDPIHDPAFVTELVTLMEQQWGEDGMGNKSKEHEGFYDLTCSQPRPAHDAGSNALAAVAVSRRRAVAMVRTALEELHDVPFFFDIASLVSRLHNTVPPLAKIKSALINSGYRLSGSHCSISALKTDAPPAAIWSLLTAWTTRAEESSDGSHSSPPNLPSAKHLQDPRSITAAILDRAHRHRQKDPQLQRLFESWDFSGVVTAGDASGAFKKKATRHIPAPTMNWGPQARASAQIAAQAAETTATDRSGEAARMSGADEAPRAREEAGL